MSNEQRAGSEAVWQTSLHNPNFAEHAQLCGAVGECVTNAGAGGDLCNVSLLKRAVHFRSSLVALYGAIGAFAVARLLGTIAFNWVAGVLD